MGNQGMSCRRYRFISLLLFICAVAGGACGGTHGTSDCPGSAASAASSTLTLDYTKKLNGVASMEQAVEQVTTALKARGFGVVTDMDVQAIMKAKLGEEMKSYRILGACNPKLAFRAISGDQVMGLLLPCKVIVYQGEDGLYNVSFARPQTVFSLVNDPALAEIAAEVDGLIRAAYESL